MTRTDEMQELRAFLAGAERNRYIHFGTIEAYVRKGHHMIEGQLTETFDFANFENHSLHKGKGFFRHLLPRLKRELRELHVARDIKCIFIESVLNERLAASLPSMGFLPVAGSWPPCFYMRIKP